MFTLLDGLAVINTQIIVRCFFIILCPIVMLYIDLRHTVFDSVYFLLVKSVALRVHLCA